LPRGLKPGSEGRVKGGEPHAERGRRLSEIHSLPYVPLLADLPPYEARKLISFECATKWRVMPVSYDVDRNVLTVAVSDADQVEMLRRVYRFFMQSHRLEFCIASQSEIAGAFVKHFGGMVGKSRRWVLRPVMSGTARKETETERKAALRASMLQDERRSARDEERNAAQEGYPSTGMGRALVGTVAFFVTKELAGEADLLDQIRSRVRYCQLLGVRMDLTGKQMDGLALGAWLSVFDDIPAVLAELDTPYALGEILSRTRLGSREERVEKRILSLVTAYEDIKATDPAAGRDVTMTRSLLQKQWRPSTDGDRMLETFLQILMDEEFVTRLDPAAGSDSAASRDGNGDRERGIKGSLEDMSFTDLIQILSAGGKNMEVTLSNGKDSGHVCLEGGEVVHADLGEQEGEEAFYGLMRWEAGEFHARRLDGSAKAGMRMPVMSLLMEGARRCDEGLEAA